MWVPTEHKLGGPIKVIPDTNTHLSATHPTDQGQSHRINEMIQIEAGCFPFFPRAIQDPNSLGNDIVKLSSIGNFTGAVNDGKNGACGAISGVASRGHAHLKADNRLLPMPIRDGATSPIVAVVLQDPGRFAGLILDEKGTMPRNFTR